MPETEPLTFETTGIEESREKVEAKIGEQLVGIIIYHEIEGGAFVESVAVSKDYRRRGIATRLIEHMQQEFDMLQTNAREEETKALFSRCGFRTPGPLPRAGIRFELFEETASVMEWRR